MSSGDSHASAFSHYVGVTGLDYRSSYGWLSHIVHNLMARYLGDEAPESSSNCKKMNNRDHVSSRIPRH